MAVSRKDSSASRNTRETLGVLEPFRLREGQAIRVRAHDFVDAYPPRLFEGHGLQASIDRFLSLCMGSAYGTWRCAIDPITQDVTVSRHPSDPRADHSGFLYHVDSDRQWMFDRVPGGWQRIPAADTSEPQATPGIDQ